MYQIIHHTSSLSIDAMHRQRTPPSHNRPQQSRMIHFRPNTPLKPTVSILTILLLTTKCRKRSQNFRHLRICLFIPEQAGQMEDVGAGEGYEGCFIVCGREEGGGMGQLG